MSQRLNDWPIYPSGVLDDDPREAVMPWWHTAANCHNTCEGHIHYDHDPAE